MTAAHSMTSGAHFDCAEDVLIGSNAESPPRSHPLTVCHQHSCFRVPGSPHSEGASYCAFDTFTTEDALCLRIIEGCQSESLRRHLLKKCYSLDEIEEMMRVNDQAEEPAKKMEAGKLEK
ncbi:hypothetical protein NDU88_003605 [Pleurodeles waltl]|uniref:Uncharacterized protein n=1 Tax=Pleurodeles waltl TaxID=8319 RepID=A0AAV7KVE8_PLEWA|nr:hypothetical protein NDU88_003605 [Pleurodeles waltl]